MHSISIHIPVDANKNSLCLSQGKMQVCRVNTFVYYPKRFHHSSGYVAVCATTIR